MKRNKKIDGFIPVLFTVVSLLLIAIATVSAAEGPAVMIVDNGVDPEVFMPGDTGTITPDWKHYPYCPLETSICFPADEGKHHHFLICPIEWWYANFHLTGSSTGTEYGAFVAFFKFPQMRLFSISDLDLQKTYTDAKLGRLIASEGKLDLTFVSLQDGFFSDSEQQLSMETGARQRLRQWLFNYDYWYTKTDGKNPVPFQYKLLVKGKAKEEDQEMMMLNVDMNCLKPPMLVGGTGFCQVGNDWTYYYIENKIEVSGNITVHGITEAVTGYAWIDHQWGWGNFDLTYEWFSIKLDDFREIMVVDSWWRNGEYYGSLYGGLNLINANYSLELLDNYTITPLDYWTDPVSGRKFATQWRIIEPSKQIDLTITADYNDQVMRWFAVFQRCFWEGSCSVSGTIEGTPVSGKAYVELTHSWENRSFNTPLSIFHRGLPNPLFFAVLLGIIFVIGIFVWVWVKYNIKKKFGK